MLTIIMDSCSYMRLGLTDYLVTQGVRKKDITAIVDIAHLQDRCSKLQPNMVFINESCFMHEADATERIKRVIDQNPNTLFLIFMTITNVHFDDYLYIRKNVIFTSKSIKTQTLNTLLARYINQQITLSEAHQLESAPLSLSQTESCMLNMWMSGHNTLQISDLMHIKAKTVSSHKRNIKRKIKTHNKQVIHHVVRLTNTVIGGIMINSR